MARSFTFNPFTGNFDAISTVDVAPVGSSPNSNAATITALGQVLTLEPADASNPGVITAGSQSFGGVKTFTLGINLASQLITNVLDPVSAQDAATKQYVDASIAALQPATSVYAATTANLTGTYLNGASGVGATFTITATGAFTLDGTTPPVNSRILIKNQSSGLQNGIYDLTNTGSLGISPILTRSADYNTAADMNHAGLIPVINGTTNALTSWLQVATITTVGTDALVFSEYTANPSLYMLKANNLSDVASAITSFNTISPLTTKGDILGYDTGNNRIPIGTNGQVLTADSTQPLGLKWAPAAAGTVTSVSVTTANGVSGSVATPTTTPAITLTLGAITPSSVNGNTITTGTGTLTLSTFTMTAAANATLSGTNTGDISLTAVGASPSANGASLSGQALTLQPFDSTHPGVVTASGGGTTNFLRADGTWAAVTATVAFIGARYKSSTTAWSTNTPIVFATQDFDTSSIYNNSTGVGTIPTTGKYRITAQLYQTGLAGASISNVWLKVNATTNAVNLSVLELFSTPSVSQHTFGGSTTYSFTSGDTFSILASYDSGTKTLGGNPEYNYFSIEFLGS